MKWKWIGIDYGQCLMDSAHRRPTTWLAPVFIELEQENSGIIDEKVEKFKNAIEDLGVSEVMRNRDKYIMSDILEDNDKLIDKFHETEMKLLKPAEGVKEILSYLKEKEIELDVTSEMRKTHPHLDLKTNLKTIYEFLHHYDLQKYFNNIITRAGSINLETGMENKRFEGKSKRDGNFYKELKKFLKEKDIDPSKEAMHIGNSAITDVRRAAEKGFTTVHYLFSPEAEKEKEADYSIRNWIELKEIV